MRKKFLDKDVTLIKSFQKLLNDGDYNSEEYKSTKMSLKVFLNLDIEINYYKNIKEIGIIDNLIIKIIDNINEYNFKEVTETLIINKKNNKLSTELITLYNDKKYSKKIKDFLRINEKFERFLNNSNLDLVKENIDYIDINNILTIICYNKEQIKLLIDKLNYSKILNNICFINYNSEVINDLIYKIKPNINNKLLVDHADKILIEGILNNEKFNEQSLIIFEDLTIDEFEIIHNKFKGKITDDKNIFNLILQSINLKQKKKIENEIASEYNNKKSKAKRKI